MEVLPLRGPPSLLCLSPAILVGRPPGVGTLMSNELSPSPRGEAKEQPSGPRDSDGGDSH